MGKTIRVYITDDHQIVRRGIRQLLSTEAGIEVVGEAENGLEAVELAYELQPQIVIMDIGMPKLNGYEATAHIRLQALIDTAEDDVNVVSPEYLQWLHKEFCDHLPDELLWVDKPDTKDRIKVIPGAFRDRDVVVGAHIPIKAQAIPAG